jgi:hypothetical protein
VRGARLVVAFLLGGTSTASAVVVCTIAPRLPSAPTGGETGVAAPLEIDNDSSGLGAALDGIERSGRQDSRDARVASGWRHLCTS